MARATACALVLGDEIHHHFFRCTDRGPTPPGENPEAAALDHGRSAHADVAVFRGDDDIASAQERSVPAKAAARGDADEGHLAGELAEGPEGEAVQPRHPDAVRIPGAAAAPSVKNTTGMRERSASSMSRSFLMWFMVPWVPASTV